MPLETGTVLSDLNASNPAHSDGLSQTDAHIRLLKTLLLATFPNINAALSVTDEQLNALATGLLSLANGTSGTPSLSFGSDPSVGIYRAAAGILGIAGKLVTTGDAAIAGRLSGNGAQDAGQFVIFPKAPSSLATGGTAVGTERYVEADGSVYPMATFPVLGAFLGATYGGNGVTTFGVPLLTDTGRFLRSRTGSLLVGTAQANAIKSHSAAVSVSGGDHGHAINIHDPGHAHNSGNPQITASGLIAGPASGSSNPQFVNVGPSAINTTTNGTGITADAGGSGSLSLSGSASYSGDTETRPESFASIICLKT